MFGIEEEKTFPSVSKEGWLRVAQTGWLVNSNRIRSAARFVENHPGRCRVHPSLERRGMGETSQTPMSSFQSSGRS